MRLGSYRRTIATLTPLTEDRPCLEKSGSTSCCYYSLCFCCCSARSEYLKLGAPSEREFANSREAWPVSTSHWSRCEWRMIRARAADQFHWQRWTRTPSCARRRPYDDWATSGN